MPAFFATVEKETAMKEFQVSINNVSNKETIICMIAMYAYAAVAVLIALHYSKTNPTEILNGFLPACILFIVYMVVIMRLVYRNSIVAVNEEYIRIKHLIGEREIPVSKISFVSYSYYEYKTKYKTHHRVRIIMTLADEHGTEVELNDLAQDMGTPLDFLISGDGSRADKMIMDNFIDNIDDNTPPIPRIYHFLTEDMGIDH